MFPYCFTWNIPADQVNTLVPPQKLIEIGFQFGAVFCNKFLNGRKGFTWNMMICDVVMFHVEQLDNEPQNKEY